MGWVMSHSSVVVKTRASSFRFRTDGLSQLTEQSRDDGLGVIDDSGFQSRLFGSVLVAETVAPAPFSLFFGLTGPRTTVQHKLWAEREVGS